MKQIINIQFLRAIAALTVMFYHFSLQYAVIGDLSSNLFFQVFNLIGYAGVDFFFVISGYIMWKTTGHTHANHPIVSFAFKRLTRIYLGYWPYFLIAILIIALFPHLKPGQANLWGSFWLTELTTNHLLIQVAWTLQYELYFYFLFTLLLLFSRQSMIRIMVVMMLVIIAYQVAQNVFTQTSAPGSLIMEFLFSPFCLEFFAGCMLAHFLSSRQPNYMITFILGISFLVFAWYYQTHIINHTLIDNNHIYMRVLVYGCAALLILASLVNMEKSGKVIWPRLSVILGGSSYSIYLSHTLAIALIYAVGWQQWIQTNSQYPGLWLGLLMLATVVYSILHYLWVEKPLMTFAHHIRKNIVD